MLSFVAVFFMPVCLRQKTYAMPPFLEQRYHATLSLPGPAHTPKGLSLGPGQFEVGPPMLALVVVILRLIRALYGRFWQTRKPPFWSLSLCRPGPRGRCRAANGW